LNKQRAQSTSQAVQSQTAASNSCPQDQNQTDSSDDEIIMLVQIGFSLIKGKARREKFRLENQKLKRKSLG